jgi:Alpha/beta hydrolase family
MLQLVKYSHWPALACETPGVAAFVLIPGAGTDPGVYDATIEALGELGHGGVAPALPLDDADAALSDHADAVVRALPADAELTVVAQSLGAFAAPLVAARAAVAQLVLVAPMIPRPGETAGEWWASTGHEEAIADLLERHGPMSSWGPDAIAEVFLHDVDRGVARDNERYQGVPGDGMFGEPWPLESWPEVPTHVLAPTEDRLFPLEFQRRVARERLGLEIDEIPGGHLPMLSRPRELAERLIELAQRGQGTG